jgi:predicted nucleic acid-binding protein
LKYLVDTNILSEMTKKQPDNRIVEWFENTTNTDMFLSVISVGELVYGVAKLPDGPKKIKLSAWLNDLFYANFYDRIIGISMDVMEVWGEMSAKLTRPIPKRDTLIAATALANNMIVVTGNTSDFKDIPGLKFLNPREN